MAPSSDVVMYYRCTSCCECFFDRSAFLNHAERVHCKVLVCQGHDPEENTETDIVSNVATDFNSLPKAEAHVVERVDIDYKAATLLHHPTVENTCSTEEGEVPPVAVKLEVIDDHSDSESAAGQTTGANYDATLTACYEESEYQMQTQDTEDVLNPVVDGAYYNPLSTYMTTEDVLNLVNNEMPYTCSASRVNDNLSREAHEVDHSARGPQRTPRKKFPSCAPATNKQIGAKHTNLHAMTSESGSNSNRYSDWNTSNRLGQSLPGKHRLMGQQRATVKSPSKAAVKDSVVCPICQKSLKHKSYLQKHLRIHTGEKPFKCAMCPSAFREYGSLISHQRTHTGEKPYKCTVCSAAFTHCSGLAFHRKIHTGEKPYVCKCGSAFNHPSNYRRHQLTACKIRNRR
ncbi:PREDICTED: zinc finger protein 681-like isoform X1 [Priapulus caudatus]|uniref:Zinc finger protein 681-like isoform X1 n=1 Tax=Priapulus caudatus TaxID=37621 RepID=A0ABM1EEG0_PRICU|nr:PREDICTED: zinc finger protein 681-like isoform X1 [Priapulus caudatus]XP_014670582.1 PREDICTED: zinc finger protein 681-like isoform X1 [Priapulus caudatus]